MAHELEEKLDAVYKRTMQEVESRLKTELEKLEQNPEVLSKSIRVRTKSTPEVYCVQCDRPVKAIVSKYFSCERNESTQEMDKRKNKHLFFYFCTNCGSVGPELDGYKFTLC